MSKQIYIDIDQVICTNVNKGQKIDYTTSVPIYDNIKKANKLFEQGHKIIYWTARGSLSGIDWTELTLKQLNDWNVLYTEVKFNKPYYDLFIDDKALNVNDWRE